MSTIDVNLQMQIDQIDQNILMPPTNNTLQMGPARTNMAVVEPVQVPHFSDPPAMHVAFGTLDNMPDNLDGGNDADMDSDDEFDESMVDIQMSIEENELPYQEEHNMASLEDKILCNSRN